VGRRRGATDLILTGSMAHVPVAVGDRVAAEITGLGRVEATIGR
jgi:2-keto-4-pentenoate hydratase